MMSNYIREFEGEAERALKHLKEEFAKLQAGQANAAMVEGMLVEAYGQKQPVKAVASISVPEANQILIQPWDKGVLKEVEKAVAESDLGVNPTNDGVCVRIILPQPTQERREALVKVAKETAEEAKISVRQARQHVLEELKKEEKAKEISEDERRGEENKLQEKVDKVNKEIEEVLKEKESSLRTV